VLAHKRRDERIEALLQPRLLHRGLLAQRSERTRSRLRLKAGGTQNHQQRQ